MSAQFPQSREHMYQIWPKSNQGRPTSPSNWSGPSQAWPTSGGTQTKKHQTVRPTLLNSVPTFPYIGPKSVEIAQVWSNLDEVCPNPGPKLAESGRTEVDRVWPNLYQIWPKSSLVRPNSQKHGRIRAKLGQQRVERNREHPNLTYVAQIRAEAGRIGPNSVRIEVDRVWPNLDRIWSTPDQCFARNRAVSGLFRGLRGVAPGSIGGRRATPTRRTASPDPCDGRRPPLCTRGSGGRKYKRAMRQPPLRAVAAGRRGGSCRRGGGVGTQIRGHATTEAHMISVACATAGGTILYGTSCLPRIPTTALPRRVRKRSGRFCRRDRQAEVQRNPPALAATRAARG